jgi:hypothetical protein
MKLLIADLIVAPPAVTVLFNAFMIPDEAAPPEETSRGY